MEDNNMYQNQTGQNNTEGSGQGMPPVQNYGGDGYAGNAYSDHNSNSGYVSGSSGGYANNTYSGGAYNGGYSNYNNGYQPYNNMPPYQDNQLELEEPVKISEWVLSMVLMMIPCVNIIFMFVFAFSKSEKKSKSNFFKAYLIVFGILFALLLVLWVFGIYAVFSLVD